MVPETYYEFIMEYAPYIYVVPGQGPDLSWGKAAFAAAYAVDYLFEAYFDQQFDARSAEIEAKIVELADFILTQQCNDSRKIAYGGFQSTENSTQYYSVDACRCIPALLKAYELTTNLDYIDSAVLAGGTFLCNMQHKPAIMGVHERYYGGFARAVSLSNGWLPQMDVECLCGLAALQLLSETEPLNRSVYEAIMADALDFYRERLEKLQAYFDPAPNGDGCWHRVDADGTTVIDDSLAYALYGVYDYEGWTITVQNTYESLNRICASSQYPAYNLAICWAGYLNVSSGIPSCDYYDAVTAGILADIRKDHDRSAYELSAQIISKHPAEFMFWGVKHTDFSFVENKQATATVSWLARFLINYEQPVTRFTQILKGKGENLTLYPLITSGEKTVYGEAIDVKAIVLPAKAEEVLIEPGYIINDFLVLHMFLPVRQHDKFRRKGQDYEVIAVQDFSFKGETAYHKVTCRRLMS